MPWVPASSSATARSARARRMDVMGTSTPRRWPHFKGPPGEHRGVHGPPTTGRTAEHRTPACGELIRATTCRLGALGVSPLAQKIVVDTGQPHARIMVCAGSTELLQRIVEVEQNRAPGLIPDHALHPEEGGQAGAPGNGLDAVHGAPAVPHHIAGGELAPPLLARPTDHELAPVVFCGIAQ